MVFFPVYLVISFLSLLLVFISFFRIF
jgi:hypothetical protein